MQDSYNDATTKTQHQATCGTTMPITTRQVAELAKVSEQTARNYTRWYGELLSPAARGEIGPRLFDDEDVRIFCAIADLRRDNVPQAEILARLRRGDIYVDHNTPQHATSESQSQKTALEATQTIWLVRLDLEHQISSLRRSYEIMERNQNSLLRAALLWGALWGAIAALAFGAFVLWLLWLVVGG